MHCKIKSLILTSFRNLVNFCVYMSTWDGDGKCRLYSTKQATETQTQMITMAKVFLLENIQIARKVRQSLKYGLISCGPWHVSQAQLHN